MACKRKPKPWPAKSVELLLYFRKEGRSYVWIANQLERTPSEVRAALARQPAEIREEVEEVRWLYFQRRRLTRQRKRINAKLKQPPVTMRPWTPFELRQVGRLRLAGLSWAAVGRLLGRSKASVIAKAHWQADQEATAELQRQIEQPKMMMGELTAQILAGQALI